MLVKYSTAYGNVAYDLSRPHIIISLSGGFDSAVTFYGLAKAIHENGTGNEIHSITVRKLSNRRGHPDFDKGNPFPIVTHLIEWVRSQFPDVKIHDNVTALVHEWWEDEFKYTQVQYDLLDQIAQEYGPENVMTTSGMTMNPPLVVGEVTVTDNNGNIIRQNALTERDEISEVAIPDTISTKSHCDGRDEFYPFRNFDKRAVFSFADTYYGDVDTFLNMTRSCEGFRRHTNNFTGVCGAGPDLDYKCWWCYEREWATEQYAKDKENGFKL